jgi:probable addiction module antidote protein
MPADEYSLRHYVAADGKRPFAEWLCSLPDRNAAARVQIRLERLRLGNFGDVRPLGKGLSELRIDVGPGSSAPGNISRITEGGQMPRSAPYDDLLMEMLKDEERALAYLDAALDERDPRVFLIALRNVTQAQGGIAKVAAHSGLNRESLYRALSDKGNPSVQTLAAVLGALGARLSVARATRPAPTPSRTPAAPTPKPRPGARRARAGSRARTPARKARRE